MLELRGERATPRITFLEGSLVIIWTHPGVSHGAAAGLSALQRPLQAGTTLRRSAKATRRLWRVVQHVLAFS